ncbi:uncharacterized protein [Eurosta solidaginis]|uniref:uncharacterized protein n=1 Tax=Eurosta solidaginis TaxID=178769 RepID=UPI0035315C4A
MFNNDINHDNDQNISIDHSAEGQRIDGMEQFSLPTLDPWQSSIDFMLWPPGSCEYGSHVASCPNISTTTDACHEQKVEDIPRSPWDSKVPSHCYSMSACMIPRGTTSDQSYYSPSGCRCHPVGRQTVSRGANIPTDSPLSQEAGMFRPKNIPLTTPVWRPGGPTQRFSNSL